MKADCHIHMILDGVYYRAAIDHQKPAPDIALIRERLHTYSQAGITFVRDGGDAWDVGLTAASIAKEYGIDYRTPAFPIYKKGRYGSFIGRGFEDMHDFRVRVNEAKEKGADFIKIMISGIMDFNEFGRISCEPLNAGEINEMIHIIHEEGMCAMAHANGAECVMAAVQSGVDSIEHGAYLTDEVLCAMAESNTIWVPTQCTINNLIGCGRYPDQVLIPLNELHGNNVRRYAAMGGLLAPGSDAGAYLVPHVGGCMDEYQLLETEIGENGPGILEKGIAAIAERFRRDA